MKHQRSGSQLGDHRVKTFVWQMRKLKLRDGKAPWIQCSFLSVNQWIFKLSAQAFSTRLARIFRMVLHLFSLNFNYFFLLVLYSKWKAKLLGVSWNCLCWRSLLLEHHASPNAYSWPVNKGQDQTWLFSVENDFLGRKWLFNSHHHRSHTPKPTSYNFSILLLMIKAPKCLFKLKANHHDHCKL